jgi:SRSO17 transposase
LGSITTARPNTYKTKKGDSHDNSPLAGVSSSFISYFNCFSDFFQTRTRNCADQGALYLKGLVQAEKKNMERMAEMVPESNEQALQHFVSNSPWDANAVMDQVAMRSNEALQDGEDRCLLIDETACLKKGTKSVGVSRQWAGTSGKVDNCQVGVFAVLGHGIYATPIDCRLHLPENWVEDPERCEAAGVPSHRIKLLRKHDLALEMVEGARQKGISFSWVGCDGFYGEDPAFLRDLDKMGEVFVADVHKDQMVWIEDPEPRVPPRKSTRGRAPEKLEPRMSPVRVDLLAAQAPASSWQRVTVRETTKGKLVVDIFHQRVWLWDGEESSAHEWHLIVRREIDGGKLKYTLSNAPADTSVERLAFAQAQRYWVERAFQESKQHSGLDDYQVRGWLAWHHHMALVMMAMQFMLEEKLKHQDLYPLLSCADIVSLLKYALPKRAVTQEEILRQMEIRHKKRKSAIESARKIQAKRLAGDLAGPAM